MINDCPAYGCLPAAFKPVGTAHCTLVRVSLQSGVCQKITTKTDKAECRQR